VLHVRDRLSQRFGVAPKGDAVEKAYSIDGDVDAGSRKLALGDQMVKPVDNLLVRDSALASADRNVRVQRRICCRLTPVRCARPRTVRSRMYLGNYADHDFTARIRGSGTPRSGFVQYPFQTTFGENKLKRSPNVAKVPSRVAACRADKVLPKGPRRNTLGIRRY